jgi:hypothetical protein
VQTFYEMSGSSDGTSLPVDAGGYVEITPTCNPAPSDTMNVTQGNNRFMANIAVTGTNWNPNPILLKLALNLCAFDLLSSSTGRDMRRTPGNADRRTLEAGAQHHQSAGALNLVAVYAFPARVPAVLVDSEG